MLQLCRGLTRIGSGVGRSLPRLQRYDQLGRILGVGRDVGEIRRAIGVAQPGKRRPGRADADNQRKDRSDKAAAAITWPGRQDGRKGQCDGRGGNVEAEAKDIQREVTVEAEIAVQRPCNRHDRCRQARQHKSQAREPVTQWIRRAKDHAVPVVMAW